MVGAAGLGIFGNMRVDEVQLAALARGVGVGDVGLAGAERLDLRAEQRDAGLEFLLDLVVEARLSILGDELAALGLALRRHDVTLKR